MIVTDGLAERFRPFKAGKFDPGLLCGPHDYHLGRHEGYAFDLLNRLNSATAGLSLWRAYQTEDFDRSAFLRFLAGLLWKYASTQRVLGRIEIGPYRERLKHVAFGDDPLPGWLDGMLFRLGTHDTGSTFYREPKPDRQLGVNIVRLSLSHFVLFVKLDQRRPESVPLADWLSVPGPVSIPIVPFNTFEEGSISLSSRTDNPGIRAFLGRQAARAGGQPFSTLQ